MKDINKENLRLKIEVERLNGLVNFYKYDTLTGLRMRRDFELKFSEFFNSGIVFYLSMIDINGLHSLNREKSYEFGDRLIKSVANTLTSKLNGAVYRIGGDEFVAITVDEPGLDFMNKNYVGSYVCSKDFKAEKEMFDKVDRKVVEVKEIFYKNNNDRRHSQADTKTSSDNFHNSDRFPTFMYNS